MMHSKIKFHVLLGFLALFMCALLTRAQALVEFEDHEMYQRYQTLIFELRCPKCQNQNVADSNAPIAEDIRQKTAQLLKQGYSNEQVMDFMVDRYTEFVTYKPRLSWVTVWLWVIPILCLLFGLVLYWRLSQGLSPAELEPLSSEDQQRLSVLLETKK